MPTNYVDGGKRLTSMP